MSFGNFPKPTLVHTHTHTQKKSWCPYVFVVCPPNYFFKFSHGKLEEEGSEPPIQERGSEIPSGYPALETGDIPAVLVQELASAAVKSGCNAQDVNALMRLGCDGLQPGTLDSYTEDVFLFRSSVNTISTWNLGLLHIGCFFCFVALWTI